MNYSELNQAIQSYSENTEQLFVQSIPTFVKEAERRIYNSVQLPSLRKNVTGTMTASNKYLALPDDWLCADIRHVHQGWAYRKAQRCVHQVHNVSLPGDQREDRADDYRG